MYHKFLAFALLFATSMFLLNCKKQDARQAIERTVNPYSEKVKSWFDSQNRSINKARVPKNTDLAARVISNTSDIRDGEPEWEKTKYFESTKSYLTPIKFTISNTNKYLDCYKYLLTIENDKADIVSGSFCYLVIDNVKTEKNFKKELISNVTPELFEFKNIDKLFFGNILKYDIDYKLQVDKTYQNGLEVASKSKIIMKLGNRLHYIDEENFPSAKTTGVKCTDWYIVVTDEETGQITFVGYFYTSCEGVAETNPNDGTSAGGGNGNPSPNPGLPCQEEQALFQAEINNTHGISGGAVSSIEQITSTPTLRKRAYEWIALINYGGFGLLSREMGVQKNVPTPNTNTPDWQWVSLEHVSLTKYGVTIGGTMEFSAVATASIGKYNAGMELKITLKWSPICDIPILNNLIPDTHETATVIINVNAMPANEY